MEYNVDGDTMSLKNDFVLFSKTVQEDHSYDIGLVQYTPSLSVMYNPNLLVDYSLVLNKVWVDGNAFMKVYGVAPKVKYVFSSSTMLGGSYSYQKKSTNTSKTQTQALDFTLNYSYSKNISFALSSGLYSEKVQSGTFSAYDIVNFSLSTAYMYMPTLIFTPKLVWYDKKFQKKDPSYLKVQKDNEYLFSFNTTYVYKPNILFSFDYTYTKHISNIPSWEFNKQMITSNVILVF